MPYRTELEEIVMSSIFHNEDGLVAIDKPAGVTTHRSSIGYPDGVREILVDATGRDFHPVHRLDKGTTGVLLLASDRGIRRSLCGQFSQRKVEKVYRAVVDGEVTDETWEVDSPIGFREAQTSFRKVKDLEDNYGRAFTLVEARPRTGRTHQIRIHLARSGYPITGDYDYNNNPSFAARPLLHALQLECRRPRTGEPLVFKTELPKDFGVFKSKVLSLA